MSSADSPRKFQTTPRPEYQSRENIHLHALQGNKAHYDEQKTGNGYGIRAPKALIQLSTWSDDKMTDGHDYSVFSMEGYIKMRVRFLEESHKILLESHKKAWHNIIAPHLKM